MLKNCPAADVRHHELFYTVGNATYRYHQLAVDKEPTYTDYLEWLEGLPEAISKDMREQGFEECKTVLSFTRYVNEKADIGLEEYLRQQVGEEVYAEYRALLNFD